MSIPRFRVLCLEDDEDSLEMMRIILASEGFDPICTASSKAGLKLAAEEKFDLYLLDSWLPDLSGIEVCKRIREFDARTPVVFHSGAAYQSDINAALNAGAQAYITKPARPEEIIRTLRSAISARV